MKRKTKEAEPMAPPEPARPRVTVTTCDGGSRVIPAPSPTAPAESATAPSLESGLDPIAESTLAPLLADAEPDSNGDH